MFGSDTMSRCSFALDKMIFIILSVFLDGPLTVASPTPIPDLETSEELWQRHSPQVHASISASAYLDDPKTKIDFERTSDQDPGGSYQLLACEEFAGLRAVVYEASDRRDLVVAFRGSHSNVLNWFFNLSHVSSAHLVPHLSLGLMPQFTSALLLALEGFFRKPTINNFDSAVSMNETRARIKRQEISDGDFHPQLLARFGILATWRHDQHRTNFNENFIKAYETIIRTLFYRATLEKLSNFVESHVLASDLGSRVYFTGHSLGGFLAQYFAFTHHCSGSSFNAPDLGSYGLTEPELIRYRRQHVFINHRMAGDIVSLQGLRKSFSLLVNHLRPMEKKSKSSNLSYAKIHSMENVLTTLFAIER